MRPRPLESTAPLKPLWAAALLMVGTLGCPHAFGRGGTIDRAVHKDATQTARPPMDYDCPVLAQDVEEFCEEAADMEECLRRCRQ